MNHVKKLLLLIYIAFALCNLGYAQTEVGSYFLESTWAARELNPSDSLRNRIEVYLPGVYIESHHTNQISLSEIIDNNGNENTLNLNSVINQLDDENTFESIFKLNSIGIGFKFKNFDLDIKHNLRLNSSINYPKELAKLLFEGNSQYIGETVSFAPSVDFFSYHEYSVGISRSFDKLSVGARAKYLSGIGLVQTDRSYASLFTDSDIYQLTFNTDYSMQASNTLDIDGLSNFTFETDLAQGFFSKNNGFAFDFGAAYQVTDDLKISVSVLDIGAINWTENTSTFASQGTYTYNGFDLDNFLLNDDESFEVKLDTLEEIFAFQETTSEVKTKLNSKVYLAGQYQLSEKIRLGALLFSNNLEFDDLAYGLNAQYQLNRTFLFGLNYSYRKDNFNNLGLEFVTKVGPVVIFGSTDNVFSVLLNNNYSLNGRIGLGLSL